jgi:hypothetical protein
LNTINKLYKQNYKNISDPDKLYNEIVSIIIDIILNSSNYKEIPIDELELCVDIIVADAFIRCKIFKNPNNYSYVNT